MTFRECLEALGRVWHGPRVPPAPKPIPPPAPPVPGDVAARLLAIHLLGLHNDLRSRHGLGNLHLDDRLMASAARESADCAKRQQMDHRGSDGTWPVDRIAQAGYTGGGTGENIAEGQTTPEQAFEDWVNDPPHLINILRPQFTDAGFAVAHDARGRSYWTADFGGPA